MLPGQSPDDRILTNIEILSLGAIPKSLIIVGSGAVGVEFASIYNSFGTDCTVIEMQHFNDGAVGAEGVVDGRELHADGARADNDQRLGNCAQAEDLDIGKNPVVRRLAGKHARTRAGGDNHVFAFTTLRPPAAPVSSSTSSTPFF